MAHELELVPFQPRTQRMHRLPFAPGALEKVRPRLAAHRAHLLWPIPVILRQLVFSHVHEILVSAEYQRTEYVVVALSFLIFLIEKSHLCLSESLHEAALTMAEVAVETVVNYVQGFLAPLLALGRNLVFDLAVVSVLELFDDGTNLLLSLDCETAPGFRKVCLDV